MRVFWLTLLATGLLLVSVNTYQAAQTGSAALMQPCDDGSGIPTPTPTPKPR